MEEYVRMKKEMRSEKSLTTVTALSTELVCLNDRNLVATVTDFEVSPAVPHFRLDDARGVADFIAARIGR